MHEEQVSKLQGMKEGEIDLDTICLLKGIRLNHYRGRHFKAIRVFLKFSVLYQEIMVYGCYHQAWQ